MLPIKTGSLLLAVHSDISIPQNTCAKHGFLDSGYSGLSAFNYFVTLVRVNDLCNAKALAFSIMSFLDCNMELFVI